MTINTERNDNTISLIIEGRLDTTTAPTLEKTINELPSDVNELILVMTSLEYISSAGLRVLLGAQKKMSKIGSMKLVNVCDAVMEVLEMTGFSDILTIE